jgi:hypothetical protein
MTLAGVGILLFAARRRHGLRRREVLAEEPTEQFCQLLLGAFKEEVATLKEVKFGIWAVLLEGKRHVGAEEGIVLAPGSQYGHFLGLG